MIKEFRTEFLGKEVEVLPVECETEAGDCVTSRFCAGFLVSTALFRQGRDSNALGGTLRKCDIGGCL
jgi:hypothetical protein